MLIKMRWKGFFHYSFAIHLLQVSVCNPVFKFFLTLLDKPMRFQEKPLPGNNREGQQDFGATSCTYLH